MHKHNLDGFVIISNNIKHIKLYGKLEKFGRTMQLLDFRAVQGIPLGFQNIMLRSSYSSKASEMILSNSKKTTSLFKTYYIICILKTPICFNL